MNEIVYPCKEMAENPKTGEKFYVWHYAFRSVEVNDKDDEVKFTTGSRVVIRKDISNE